MTESNKKYFTLAEANQMIPSVEGSFRRIFQMNIKINQLVTHLKLNQVDPSIIMINQENEFDEETLDAVTSIKVMLNTIQKEVDAIKQRGILVKNVEKGYLHFNSKVGNDDIVLCWEMGDQTIQHWQDVTNKQKPINDLITNTLID